MTRDNANDLAEMLAAWGRRLRKADQWTDGGAHLEAVIKDIETASRMFRARMSTSIVRRAVARQHRQRREWNADL